MSAAVEVQGLTAGYGPTTVLQDLDLSVPSQQKLAVLGRNGMGKTTLLRALMGLCDTQVRQMSLDGTRVDRLPTHRRADMGLGYVAQTRDVFGTLTVEENLIAGARPGSDWSEAYALFPALSDRRRSLARHLSGGEQQMLAVARALGGKPRTLLLDEPLEGLAPVICDTLMDRFEDLARRGLTLVLVEQQIARALAFADRVIVLDAGRIVHDGPAAALRHDPAPLDRLIGLSGRAEVPRRAGGVA